MQHTFADTQNGGFTQSCIYTLVIMYCMSVQPVLSPARKIRLGSVQALCNTLMFAYEINVCRAASMRLRTRAPVHTTDRRDTMCRLLVLQPVMRVMSDTHNSYMIGVADTHRVCDHVSKRVICMHVGVLAIYGALTYTLICRKNTRIHGHI